MWIAMFVLTALVLLPFVLTSLREVYEANQLVTYADTLLNVQSDRVSVQLSGAGQWANGRLQFKGEARAQPALEAALSNLLNILGQRQGTISILQLG